MLDINQYDKWKGIFVGQNIKTANCKGSADTDLMWVGRFHYDRSYTVALHFNY